MRTFLKKTLNLKEHETDRVLSYGHEKKLPERTIFFFGGQVFNKFFFVQSGIIRSFRLIDHEDYSFFFFTNNEFAVDFESFLTDTPSSLYFESLSDCSVIEFTKTTFLSLCEEIPQLEKLHRMLAESAFLNVHERLKQFQTDNLEMRYLRLIERNPELFQSVPQYHIASYLGAKPQSLSRIRAKLALQNRNA